MKNSEEAVKYLQKKIFQNIKWKNSSTRHTYTGTVFGRRGVKARFSRRTGDLFELLDCLLLHRRQLVHRGGLLGHLLSGSPAAILN